MMNDFNKIHELEKLHQYLYGAHHASENDEWLKSKGLDFQKKLIDNEKLAKLVVKNFDLSDCDLNEAFIIGFRACNKIVRNDFDLVFPQQEINNHIDRLIEKLRFLKL